MVFPKNHNWVQFGGLGIEGGEKNNDVTRVTAEYEKEESITKGNQALRLRLFKNNTFETKLSHYT